MPAPKNQPHPKADKDPHGIEELAKESRLAAPDEHFFHQVIESLEDYAVFTTNAYGQINSWNTGATRLFGYHEDEIVGKDAILLFTEEDRQEKQPEKEMASAIENGRGVDERWHLRKDGTKFWASGRVFPLKNEQGEICGFTKIARDLTEREQARAALQESETHKSAFFETSLDAIITMDAAGIIQQFNRAAERIFGYHREEVLGKEMASVIIPERWREAHRRGLAHYLVSGEGAMLNQHVEVTALHHDGHEFPVELTITKVANSLPPVFMGTLRDITEQQAQAAQAAMLAALVASSDDVIVSKTLQGVITSWNRAAEELFGYKAEEAIGQHINLIIPLELRSQEEEILRRISQGKPIRHFETVRVTKHGELIDLSLSISPIKDTHGNIIGAAKIARDIRERKKLERQKDDFVGIATHELKTPVTSIKAYTQVLQHRFSKRGDTAAEEALAKMNSQIDKLTTLISDLLDVTKIEAGRLQFHEEDFDFDRLVGETIEELQHTTQRHRIIQDGQTAQRVHGDRERLGQVLTNLLSNAIKYSPQAEQIVVHASAKEGQVVVCVEDFGVGIPQQKQAHVFERFYRVSGPREDTFPGLGLGLYISAEIMQRQGGRIWVESTEGRGATFCFSLPIIQDTEANQG